MTAETKISKTTCDDESRRQHIAKAVQNLDLTRFPCWNDLDALSSNTIADEIEVIEDAIDFVKDHFDGVINVYVTLQYGRGDKRLMTSEGFPGQIEGHFEENGEPVVDHVFVDTTSFHE